MATQDEIEKIIKYFADYKYRQDIESDEDILKNFRDKFEFINNVELLNSEFERLLDEITEGDIFEIAKKINKSKTFIRNDKSTIEYELIDSNGYILDEYEIIYRKKTNNLFILINGLPLVQIEIESKISDKVSIMKDIIKNNHNEINANKKSLMSFVQIFVVDAWYFPNNNKEHFNLDTNHLPIYTFFDENNNKIDKLYDFIQAVLHYYIIVEILFSERVFNEEKRQIILMRAHQIYAINTLLYCVKVAHNKNYPVASSRVKAMYNPNISMAYIWHTTGSGKTLTIFKLTTLLKNDENIKKIIFVVDRKDLEKQSVDEFNTYLPSYVKANKDTNALIKQIISEEEENKVIITSIQKISIALQKKEKIENKNISVLESIKNENIVFIFDECHRSQFGKNHKAIKRFFKNAKLFGFTGTPIFEHNAIRGLDDYEQFSMQKTKSLFKNLLHSYTIKNAIEDNFVIPFKVDYFEIDKENKENRKEIIAKFILDNHESYSFNREFNAILATSTIKDAIEYYAIFKELQKNIKIPLNISCVFSPPTKINEEENLAEESEYLLANKIENEKKKQALEEIIEDYNTLYKTSYSLKNFNSYYEDVQKRLKIQKESIDIFPQRKKIDIVIVVDMLLTGFDSKYLNTLYVDKNLKWHTLVQAFSRTNRTLNAKKEYGNIIDFNNQKEMVDRAIALFSKNRFEDEEKYVLINNMINSLEDHAVDVKVLKSHLEEEIQDENFIRDLMHYYNRVHVQRLYFDQYTNLSEEDKKQKEAILSDEEFDVFKSKYNNIVFNKSKFAKENSTINLNIKDKSLIYKSSCIIDYDYITSAQLMAKEEKYSQNIMLTKEKIIDMLQPISEIERKMKHLEHFADMISHINAGKIVSIEEIKEEYIDFRDDFIWHAIESIAGNYEANSKDIKEFMKNTVKQAYLDYESLAMAFYYEVSDEVEEVKAALIQELFPYMHVLAKEDKKKYFKDLDILKERTIGFYEKYYEAEFTDE